MNFLRVRKIDIDVIPDKEPFVLVYVDKVIADDSGENILQVIGDFDRINRKLSDVPNLPLGTIGDDGIISALELYQLIAQVAYSWLMQKHKGTMVGSKLVVD